MAAENRTSPAPAAEEPVAALDDGRSRLSVVLSEAKRLPLFPIAILLIVLVIPAIFANQIAPTTPPAAVSATGYRRRCGTLTAAWSTSSAPTRWAGTSSLASFTAAAFR